MGEVLLASEQMMISARAPTKDRIIASSWWTAAVQEWVDEEIATCDSLEALATLKTLVTKSLMKQASDRMERRLGRAKTKGASKEVVLTKNQLARIGHMADELWQSYTDQDDDPVVAFLRAAFRARQFWQYLKVKPSNFMREEELEFNRACRTFRSALHKHEGTATAAFMASRSSRRLSKTLGQRRLHLLQWLIRYLEASTATGKSPIRDEDFPVRPKGGDGKNAEYTFLVDQLSATAHDLFGAPELHSVVAFTVSTLMDFDPQITATQVKERWKYLHRRKGGNSPEQM